jgi:HD-like signal output (HDOD) protein
MTYMTTKEVLLKNLENLDKMPSIPVVVAPLLRYLEQPVDQLDVQKVVSLLAQDKSLTAQSLHMANSPLFGHWQTIDSLKGAVVSLGFQRLRDIVISCSVLRLMPLGESKINPVVFWEHSLGCALVCRHFAREIAFPHPEKAYLGGLLHDLGILVNLWILPQEFGRAVDHAQAKQVPLFEVEREMFGITHCETGRMLAERWGLTPDLIEAVSYHHDAASAKTHRSLVALVALSDLLCRMADLGHGYQELCQVSFQEEPAFEVLLEECPALTAFDWARFTFELEGYLDEVHQLVRQLYGTA